MSRSKEVWKEELPMTSEKVCFRLDSSSDLVSYPDDDILELDWHADLPMIQEFYRHWDMGDIQPPDETEPETGNPIALVQDGVILSFAIPFCFHEGAVEISAVATLPHERNKCFCRRVICEMARRILASSKHAPLTTRPHNLAMQAAARAIGMHQIKPGG